MNKAEHLINIVFIFTIFTIFFIVFIILGILHGSWLVIIFFLAITTGCCALLIFSLRNKFKNKIKNRHQNSNLNVSGISLRFNRQDDDVTKPKSNQNQNQLSVKSKISPAKYELATIDLPTHEMVTINLSTYEQANLPSTSVNYTISSSIQKSTSSQLQSKTVPINNLQQDSWVLDSENSQKQFGISNQAQQPFVATHQFEPELAATGIPISGRGNSFGSSRDLPVDLVQVVNEALQLHRQLNIETLDEQVNARINTLTTDPDLIKKTKLIHQRFISLLHAYKCQMREQQQKNGDDPLQQRECSFPNCKTIKNVLNHTTACTAGRSCTFAHCASSRKIISHWKYCKKENCLVCLPFRQAFQDRTIQQQVI